MTDSRCSLILVSPTTPHTFSSLLTVCIDSCHTETDTGTDTDTYTDTHTHVYTHDWLLGLNVLVFPTTAHRFSRLLTVFFDSCHTHACTPTHMHACAHTHTHLIIGFKFPGVPYYCKQLQQTAQSSLTAVTHTHTNTRMHARAHTHTNTHDLVVMTPLHIMQVIWKTRNFAVQPTLETKSSYI